MGDVYGEHPSQEDRPRKSVGAAGRALSGALGLAPLRYDLVPVAGAGRQYAVGADEVDARRRHQRDEFFDQLAEHGRDQATGEQELFPTCQAGMALLLVGQIETARKAGEWLKRLWELQPDVAHQLYHVYSPAKGLVTDYTSDQEALYLTKKDEPWQHHFNGGIAAAFLTQFYMRPAKEIGWIWRASTRSSP